MSSREGQFLEFGDFGTFKERPAERRDGRDRPGAGAPAAGDTVLTIALRKICETTLIRLLASGCLKGQQKIKIPAKTVVKFRVAKAAKDAVFGGKEVIQILLLFVLYFQRNSCPRDTPGRFVRM
jgi:nucleoid DNA-binding protein